MTPNPIYNQAADDDMTQAEFEKNISRFHGALKVLRSVLQAFHPDATVAEGYTAEHVLTFVEIDWLPAVPPLRRAPFTPTNWTPAREDF